MASNGSKTLIGVLLAAFSGAVIGLFVLIGLIFLVPTGASNSSLRDEENRPANSAPTNKLSQANIPSPTPEQIEQTPVPEENETPEPTPKTTFTPITLPTPAVRPSKTPIVISPTPSSGKPPKTVPKPSPKKPIPTPSVHT